MITSVHIENFKCFKNFDIELDKFTVLIGPNGSGKTSFLQAIELSSLVVGLDKQRTPGLENFVPQLRLSLGDHLLWRSQSGQAMRIVTSFQGTGSKPVPALCVTSTDGESFAWGPAEAGGDSSELGIGQRRALQRPLESVGCHRFDPVAMKQPSRLRKMGPVLLENGEGLANAVVSLLGSDRSSFDQLELEFCERFPEYTGLRMEPETLEGTQDVGMALKFPTRTGPTLPAEAVSDGTILSLAFMAVARLSKGPGVLLMVEEPERGVHHASLKEITRTLRELADKKAVQIVLTTHSPYLLDCVEPEEVRVFRKDSEGAAHAAKLSDYPDVGKWKKHFMTGEIWTGLDENDIAEKEGVGK
jgi:predicted ATPase